MKQHWVCCFKSLRFCFFNSEMSVFYSENGRKHRYSLQLARGPAGSRVQVLRTQVLDNKRRCWQQWSGPTYGPAGGVAPSRDDSWSFRGAMQSEIRRGGRPGQLLWGGSACRGPSSSRLLQAQTPTNWEEEWTPLKGCRHQTGNSLYHPFNANI